MFFMAVEITFGVNKKQVVLYSALLKSRKKHYKVTYLNWKANRKENTEEALYNLSCDNVYLLFALFCRFHETFGLN